MPQALDGDVRALFRLGKDEGALQNRLHEVSDALGAPWRAGRMELLRRLDVARQCGSNLNDNEIGALRTAYRTLVFRYPNDAGFNKFSCTPNHIVFTPDGEVSAEDLSIGDQILARHQGVKFSSDLQDLLLGSILGDGSIKQEGHMTAYFREEHCQEQKAYVKWKQQAFGKLCRKPSDNARGYGFSTVTLHELARIRAKFYSRNKRYKHITTDLLEQLNPLSLAIWYLDDGTNNRQRKSGNKKTIYLHRLTEEECRAFESVFAAKFNLTCRIKYQAAGFCWWTITNPPAWRWPTC